MTSTPNPPHMNSKTRRPRRGTEVTIDDVALTAGVSKTTVSHVLSGKRPVSATTQKHVEQVMSQLGFQPNFFARALNNNRSHTIALLAQDITNPFYPALARGVQGSVLESGHVVLLFDGDAGPGATRTFIQDAIQRKVDGMVVAVSDIDDDIVNVLKAKIPVVVVGGSASKLELDWVTADDAHLAEDVVDLFAGAGHTAIATISGPRKLAPGGGRHRGFLSGLSKHGLPAADEFIVEGDWTREGGFQAMRKLLALENRPTAVFCANDLMAIGAIDAARREGLRIPDDIAIVGVDDIDAASLVNPALTTVRIPAEEIGRAAGELLMHRIDNEVSLASPPRHVLVQHRLLVRESS